MRLFEYQNYQKYSSFKPCNCKYLLSNITFHPNHRSVIFLFHCRSTDSTRDSVVESEPEFLQGTNTLMNGKSKSEKSSSPPNGSISSVEDESGFSSMNSFQEVGLPVIQPPPTEEVIPIVEILIVIVISSFIKMQ